MQPLCIFDLPAAIVNERFEQPVNGCAIFRLIEQGAVSYS